MFVSDSLRLTRQHFRRLYKHVNCVHSNPTEDQYIYIYIHSILYNHVLHEIVKKVQENEIRGTRKNNIQMTFRQQILSY